MVVPRARKPLQDPPRARLGLCSSLLNAIKNREFLIVHPRSNPHATIVHLGVCNQILRAQLLSGLEWPLRHRATDQWLTFVLRYNGRMSSPSCSVCSNTSWKLQWLKWKTIRVRLQRTIIVYDWSCWCMRCCLKITMAAYKCLKWVNHTYQSRQSCDSRIVCTAPYVFQTSENDVPSV